MLRYSEKFSKRTLSLLTFCFCSITRHIRWQCIRNSSKSKYIFDVNASFILKSCRVIFDSIHYHLHLRTQHTPLGFVLTCRSCKDSSHDSTGLFLIKNSHFVNVHARFISSSPIYILLSRTFKKVLRIQKLWKNYTLDVAKSTKYLVAIPKKNFATVTVKIKSHFDRYSKLTASL